MTLNKSALTLVGLASLVLSATAQAAPECLDDVNMVCITETLDTDLTAERNKNTTRYSITNNSETQIFAFAVSNTDAANAFIETGFTGWKSKTISLASWNGGSYIGFNSDSSSQTWLTGTFGNGNLALGSFAEIFGETAEQDANIYWNSGNDNPLTSGVTFDAFLFDGLPASNFVAFDQNGSIITSSLTASNNVQVAAPVPEPSQYAMLLAGIALILCARNKYSLNTQKIN